MSDTANTPLPQRLAQYGFLAALLVLVLVWPAALAIDALATKTVVTIGSKLGPEEIEVNQSFFDPDFAIDRSAPEARQKAQLRREIASIYGLNPSEPIEVLFVPDDALIIPKEDPSMRLFVRRPGDYVLQRQTVYWFARMVTFGAGGAALLLFGLWMALRRRGAPHAAAHSPGA